MAIENEVAALTTQTTTLLQEATSTQLSVASTKVATVEAQRDIAIAKATLAASSQAAAANSVLAATASATAATNKATEAAGYEATALAKKNLAAQHTTDAATQAGIAAGKITVATAKATEASGHAAESATSKTTAQGHATTATTKAGVATTKAGEAATSAAAAATSAANAATSVTNALAIYGGSTDTMRLSAAQAQAQALLAAKYAASASSALQQDLTGVTAAALHRSPNPVTAMFVYNTALDSDGGAWVDKCSHTSWYNEPLMGKWLGAQTSEFLARCEGASLGPELVVNGGFDTDSAWTKGSEWAISGGVATATSTTTYAKILQTISGLEVGSIYKITFTVTRVSGGSATVVMSWGTSDSGWQYLGTSTAPYTYVNYFIATATSQVLAFEHALGVTFTLDNVSLKKATPTTASGDYYQAISTDTAVGGKFYRLYQNLLAYSEDLTGATWSVYQTTKTSSSQITVDNAGGAGLAFVGQGFSTFGATPYTFFVDLKYVNKRWAWLEASSLGSLALHAWFDIQNGVVGSKDTLIASSSITSLGDGWYRCAITFTGDASDTSGSMRIGMSDANDSTSCTRDGGGTIQIRNAQLNLGASALSYESKGAPTSTAEVFRGNKARFPKLAGIVAEASNLTIYDLTEPGRPMWMRFVVAAGNHLWTVNQTTALNGVLSVATSGHLRNIELLKDRTVVVGTSAVYTSTYNSNIAQRNSTTAVLSKIAETGTLPSQTVNAIAMAVLPDAPTDPVTGLKVPTIAVATGGGFSVIKHDGTVANSAHTGAMNSIVIDKSYVLAARSDGSAKYGAYNPGSLAPGFPTTMQFAGNAPDVLTSVAGTLARHQRERLLINNISLVSLLKNNETTVARGIGSRISNTYNTGHLVGDIKRCWLSGSAAGSIASPEIAPGLASWIVDAYGSWTDNGNGSFTYTVTTAGQSRPGVRFTTPDGKRYRVRFTIVSMSLAQGNIRYSFDNGGGFLFLNSARSVDVFMDGPAYGGAAQGFCVRIENSSAPVGDSFTIRDVSVREVVEYDRSYFGKQIVADGTLTKSAVATGAQLVGYSGFSAANYLREPYSTDLDFGTGEWSVGSWVKVPTTLPATSFPLSGTNLITNPGPFSNLTGWQVYLGGINISINNAKLRASYTSGVSVYTAINNTVVGKTYKAMATVELISTENGNWTEVPFGLRKGDTVNEAAYATSNIGSYVNLVITGTTTATITLFFTATATTTYLSLYCSSGGPTTIADWSSISTYEVLPASVVDRGYSSGSKLSLGSNPFGKLVATASDGTTTRTVTSSAAYNLAMWVKAEATYKAGKLAILVNGQEVASTNGTPLLTLNNSNAVLTVGNSYALDAPFPGSIALLKLSATVPTTDQAQWMYEQEKQLFREGAQCCLPDSNSIVDLTYDDATDSWSAASSTNVSSWTGLVRTGVSAVPAGSYSKLSAGSGLQLAARTTTNPGVDITIPSYTIKSELARSAESAAQAVKEVVTFDFDPPVTFTANSSVSSNVLANVSSLTGVYVGMRVTGTGLDTNTAYTVTNFTSSPNTIYLSANATGAGTGTTFGQADFTLPAGYTTVAAYVSGAQKRMGSGKDFTLIFDGFRETVRFGTSPGANWTQIHAVREGV